MSDTVVRRRPFWSFFILGTEKWLGGMSSSGLHLCNLNFRGNFRFKTGEPQKYRYCFTYQKFEGSPCRSKPNKYNWERLAQHDKWSIYKSTKDTKQSAMPNRRGLYLRNNSLLCLYAFISSIVLLAALGIVFGVFTFFSSNAASNEDFFRQAIIIIGVFVILLLSNFVLFLFLTSANSRILEESGEAVPPEYAYRQFISHKTFEEWLEKLLIKDGDIFKRFRPLWFISPRGFENWLSRMERHGLNVYKVHKSGALFYFIKSSPRKIRYCVISSEGDGVSQFIENGWQVVYSTVGHYGRFGRIAVISQAFEDKMPNPFKSEKESISNAARIMSKFFISYLIALIVLIAVIFVLVYFGASSAGIWAVGIAASVCALFIVRILLYFANTVIIARRGRFKEILH